MGKYAGIEGDYYYSKKKWAEEAKKAAEAKGHKATVSGGKGYWHLKVEKKAKVKPPKLPKDKRPRITPKRARLGG